jgi:hypothetical protein
VEEVKLEIEFNWKDFESNEGVSYVFPSPPTSNMRRYAGPGVYRWAVYSGEVLEAVYIGEAEDLLRRLQHYLYPGKTQVTNLRIKAMLEKYLAGGHKVSFQFLRFDQFVINRHAFGCSHLSDPFARKVIENLAILESFHWDCEVLNKGKNVIQKKIDRINVQFAKLPPDEQRKFIKKLKAMPVTKDQPNNT